MEKHNNHQRKIRMEFLFYKQLINQNPKAMNKSMDNKMISSSLILNKMEILSTTT